MVDNGCAVPAGAPATAACVQTHALLAASPALDTGAANGLTTDQRGTGFPRVSNGQADIGAFEVDNIPPADPTVISTTPNPAANGDIVTTLLEDVEPGAIVTIPGMNCSPSPADASGNVSCTGRVGENGLDGSDTTITVTDGTGNANNNLSSGLVVDNTSEPIPTLNIWLLSLLGLMLGFIGRIKGRFSKT